MNYGMLRAIAMTWVGTWPVFRLLVSISDVDWAYLYIPATNYQFHVGDIVSWNEDSLVWHAINQSIKFNLLETGVVHKQ